MATKLYPPQLEGTLPAFYKTYSNSKTKADGANIMIPFGNNRVVNPNDVKSMYARIRTIATNTYVVTKEVKAIDWTSMIANLELTAAEANKLNEGLYYKLQIAYIDSNDLEGYSSTVGIIKCISKPTVTISNFETFLTNQYANYVTGVYQLDTTYGDSTEKVYSYEFTLWDDKDNVLVSSGVLLHDSTQDISSYESEDYFLTLKKIKEGTVGFLLYTVTTMNGLVISSPKYQVMKSRSVDITNPINVYAQNIYEEGYINISFYGYVLPDAQGVTHLSIYSGTFVITRGSELDNYDEWVEITRFVIDAGYPSDYSFRDYTVLQGVRYRYALLLYNQKGLYSNETYSQNILANGDVVNEPTYADFEDMFLYDGTRLLKVRFNPKVDSFKNTIPELKIETIGSKYPFIFRNGLVCYKEFPIAGLLSFLMDENVLFLQGDEIRQAGIMEEEKIRYLGDGYYNTFNETAFNSDRLTGVESNYYKLLISEEPILDPNTGAQIKDKDGNLLTKKTYKYTKKDATVVSTYESYNVYLKKIQKINLETNLNDYIALIPEVNRFALVLIDICELKHTSNIYSNNYDENSYGLITINDSGRTKIENFIKDNKTIKITSNRNVIEPTEIYSTTGANIVRLNKDLTSENMMSERYFKLKVLDWLTDGKVKLFRSPSEGNYLVRLLNVSMKPIDTLGRMIHEFTCTGYEIAELTYDNLIYYNIIDNSAPNIIETHWSSFDLTPLIENKYEYNKEHPDEPMTWIQIPLDGAKVESIELTGFAPGDLVHLSFADDIQANDAYFTIGPSGNFNYSYDDRTIALIEILPIDTPYNDFDRNIVFSYPGNLSTTFDTIKTINTHTQVAEEFVGPKDNLLAAFDILEIARQYGNQGASRDEGENLVLDNLINKNNINYCLGEAGKFTCLNTEILYVRKRTLIPIYACENLIENNGEFNIGANTKFCVTPFGIGYVNSQIIVEDGATGPKKVKVIKVGENEILGNGFNSYDISELSHSDDLKFYYYDSSDLVPTVAPDGFLIFEVYVPKKDENDNWIWIKSNLLSGLYYDTFTKTWWEGNELYNPTFYINTTEKMPLVEKANRYYLGEGETKESWHPIEGTNPINEMGIYSNQSAVVNAAYNSYTLEESNENTNIISVNEIEEITLRDLGEIECISLGNGVIADITCQLLVIDYLIEDEDAVLSEAKDLYRKVNPDGSISGAVGEAANAIHDFMTRYTEKEMAQAEINILEALLRDLLALIPKYEDAIQKGIVIRQGLYKRLLNYIEELYYDIQGEGTKPSADTAIKYILPLYTIFKYLKREKYASDKYFWDNTIGFNPNSSNSYYYFYDDKNAILKYEKISDEEKTLIKKFDFGRSINQLTAEDFPIILDEIDNEGNYTNTVKGLKNQILKIASDNIDYNSDAESNSNGDLFEIIELFNSMLDLARVEFDRLNIINNTIVNSPELYSYVLVTPKFFIKNNNTTPTYDISAYTYYNQDENGNFVSKLYFDSDTLKEDVENRKVYLYYITYDSYIQFLTDNILNKLYDTSKPKDSDIPDTDRIYDLLHYFNSLKEDVLTGLVLSLDRYGEIFFLGKKIEDYDWMYITDPYTNLTENTNLEDLLFKPKYAKSFIRNESNIRNNNITYYTDNEGLNKYTGTSASDWNANWASLYIVDDLSKHYQGLIVDTYDNVMNKFQEDISALKIKLHYDNLMVEYTQPYIQVDKTNDNKPLLIFIKLTDSSTYDPQLEYYTCQVDDDDPDNSTYTLWELSGSNEAPSNWSTVRQTLYYLNTNLDVNFGEEDGRKGYYYKVENENEEPSYVKINKNGDKNNYIDDIGDTIIFEKNIPLYRTTYYEKALRWIGLRNAISDAEEQKDYWQAIINAKGVIDSTIVDGKIPYNQNDLLSIENLLAYAHDRVNYYNLRIMLYNNELDQAARDYQDFLTLESASQKATNNYNTIHNEYNTLFTTYTNLVDMYISLILHTDNSTENTTSFLDWWNKYNDLVTNGKAYGPTSPIMEEINKNISELDKNYSLFKQYLIDMLYNNSGTKAANLINNFNEIVDTWETQKKFNEFYDNDDIENLGKIQETYQEIDKIENILIGLREIVNSINVSDNFNEENYITEIKKSLAHYLYTLGIVYLDKVERRYG